MAPPNVRLVPTPLRCDKLKQLDPCHNYSAAAYIINTITNWILYTLAMLIGSFLTLAVTTRSAIILCGLLWDTEVCSVVDLSTILYASIPIEIMLLYINSCPLTKWWQ